MEKLVKEFLKDCDIEKLKKQAQTDISIAMMNDYVDDYNESYVAYVGDCVSGSYGHYQAEKLCEYFGIEYYDDSDVWIDIDRIADKIADELTRLCELDGQFYFAHLEADGSYGLFYTEAKEVSV